MEEDNPNLCIIDVQLPDLDGIELTKRMIAIKPPPLVLVVSMHEESAWALKALRAGARGYVIKQEAVKTLVGAVEKVLNGEIFVSPRLSEHLVFKAFEENGSALPADRLSARELEVFRLLGRGHSTRDLAKALSLSVKTVETHQAHIRDKLGMKTGPEVVAFAKEWIITQE